MQKEVKFIIQKFREFLSRKINKYDEKLPYIFTVIIALIIVISGIKIFVELTENLHTDVLGAFDTKITDYIISFRNPALTSYFSFVTEVGDALGYLVVFTLCSILFYFIFKRWKYAGQLTLVLLLALSSNVILKQIINRARPTLEHLVTVKTLSYPSGHAMTAMAFYGFLIYLITTFNIRKVLKFSFITLLSFLILSIGISRIYLGVHFPSDILGGFIAGFVWVIFCVLLLNILKLFKEDPVT
ncbi:phosphatase PAP2 family protein [Polaribacter aestuariivivens]|uniref:Phosphatase PAP2 family protein n=1 Tax=Polaribacter aestuariivivens TaxID=2304626 RepID=A0A5S3N2Y5_9FLAO|nr:phosphatase PAP2 family protein [Polaribacter aestuariivivens]TMM29620.1 phosphatase PAP2 family protein [Polaribacter aestuariivivens]